MAAPSVVGDPGRRGDVGPRFVVCGESLIDLVADDPDSTDTFATSWSALSAGGPMSTAVGLAMLGADSHYLGRLSTDAFGRQLRGHLEKAGVQLDLAVTSDQFTSLAVVSLDEQKKASYAFHFDQTSNFDWHREELPELTPTDRLHLGSLALIVDPGAGVLLDWVASVGAPVSVDLNVRSSVIGDPDVYWQRIEPWLRAIGPNAILKASDEDVEFLASALAVSSVPAERRASPGGAVAPGAGEAPVSGRWREACERWIADYPLELIVITQGAGGACALTTDGRWTDVPGYPTEVVDTVGAGDTFMAGFLDGHVRLGLDLDAALRRGAAGASIVCSRQGAQPPTAEEIAALQEESS